MTPRFFTLDVFAEMALAGNPLAVVLDCEGLDDGRMQAIAREFNLSETVFVFEPRNAVNTAASRIFTPAPRVAVRRPPDGGTACLTRACPRARSARRAGRADRARGRRRRRRLRRRAIAKARRWPRISTCRACPSGSKPRLRPRSRSPSASALRGGDRLRPPRAQPVQRRRALSLRSRALPRRDWPRAAGRHAMERRRRARPPTLHQRSRRGRLGLSCADVRRRLGRRRGSGDGQRRRRLRRRALAFDRPDDGEHVLTIEQGFEMGRPSRIALGFEVEGGELRSASIGGYAVIVSSGVLDL